MDNTCLSPAIPLDPGHKAQTSASSGHNNLHHHVPNLDPEASESEDCSTGSQNSEGSSTIMEDMCSGKQKEKETDDEKGHKDNTSSINRMGSAGGASLESRKRSSGAASLEDGPGSSLPSKKRQMHSDPSQTEDSIQGPPLSGLSVDQLLERVEKKRRKGLFAEYASIRSEPPSGTFHHSRSKQNLLKNRYTDVLSYDHSRVKLSVSNGDLTADYINANFVDGYKQCRAYISTQGPLPKTFADFWRMVWQQQTQVIVMTTRTVERHRLKCGQYWPEEEGSEQRCEEFVISNTSVQPCSGFIHTTLLLHNTSVEESREVTHLQFTKWPDHGVAPADSFLRFLFRVRSAQEAATRKLGSSWKGHFLGPPIVVHCSAGIGRTGTFIAIDICLRSLVDTSRVDVPGVVRKIRSQRALSIQTAEQYVFCHLAVLQDAVCSGRLSRAPQLDSSDSESD